MGEALTENSRDQLFSEASSRFGMALQRLAAGYELNADRRRDLLQEIHLALWRSLEKFDGRCSLRTWVYRVGHNVAVNHVIRERQTQSRVQLGVDEIEIAAHGLESEEAIDFERTLQKLTLLIHELKAPDRQIMLLYLDDVDGKTIAEVTGLSPGNVATKIHRIKALLVQRFHSGEKDDAQR